MQSRLQTEGCGEMRSIGTEEDAGGAVTQEQNGGSL